MTRVAVLGLVLASTLGACAGDDGTNKKAETETKTEGTATTEVAVKDFAFAPMAITVKAGSTVTWTNEDEFDHSIDIKSLDLVGKHFGPKTKPVDFSYQFTKAGTYGYLCGIHNSMKGTVVVTS